MITLESEEQRNALLILANSATFQGFENAKKLVKLIIALQNAKIEVVEKDTARLINNKQ